MVNIVLLVNCGVIFALFGSVLSGNVNESGTELYADPDMPPLEACDDTDDDGPNIPGAVAVRMKGPNGKTHRVRRDEGFIWISPNGPTLLFSKDDDGPRNIEHIYTLRTAGIQLREETGKRVRFDCNEGIDNWIEFKTLDDVKKFKSLLSTPRR